VEDEQDRVVEVVLLLVGEHVKVQRVQQIQVLLARERWK
jgi:hypothetical protein